MIQSNFKAVALTLLLSSLSFGATVATVNGTKIDSVEIDQVLMQGTQGRFNTLPVEKQDELRQKVIDGMVTQELVFTDAQKMGIMDSPEYKMELDAVLERIKKQLAAKVWEKKQFDKVELSEKKIKEYYKNNPQEFTEQEQVHARHILLKTEDEAKKIISELKALSGKKLKEKFIELAKSKSTGPSASKGGDLGYFSHGQMVPAFDKAVFALSAGSITPKAVKTQFGYHVIYLENKKDAKALSYNEVKNSIEQRLKVEKFKGMMEKKMAELKAKAKITYSN